VDDGSASVCASHFRPDLGILATWSGRLAESHSSSDDHVEISRYNFRICR